MNTEYVIPPTNETTSGSETLRLKAKKVAARTAGIAILAAGAGYAAYEANEYLDMSFHHITVDEAVGGSER